MGYYNTYEKPVKLYYNYPLENCELIDTITIKSSYISSWTNNLDESHELGGIYLKRTGKILDHFKCSIKNSGDYHYRNFISIARHLITFNSTLDKEFQVQINKSHIKESDINENIRETIKKITEAFSKDLWNKFKKTIQEPIDPKPINPQPVNPQPVNPQPVNPQPVNPQPVNPQPVNPQPVKLIGFDIKLNVVDNKLTISNNSINIMTIQNQHIKQLYEEYLKKLTNQQFVLFIKEQAKLMEKYGLQ
jgi:hypothetical protein